MVSLEEEEERDLAGEFVPASRDRRSNITRNTRIARWRLGQ